MGFKKQRELLEAEHNREYLISSSVTLKYLLIKFSSSQIFLSEWFEFSMVLNENCSTRIESNKKVKNI